MNSRGQILKCSWYIPDRDFDSIDCIVYCHGNSGSRLDAMESVEKLLPVGMSVFAFDFAGCGMSEGDYISLGFYEKDDIASIVNFLRNVTKIRKIGLWGRSMGAVSCLRYASGDPDLFCLILDSAFTNLSQLCRAIGKKFKFLPDNFIEFLVSKIRDNV